MGEFNHKGDTRMVIDLCNHKLLLSTNHYTITPPFHFHLLLTDLRINQTKELGIEEAKKENKNP
jgi:hypothetical protein